MYPGRRPGAAHEGRQGAENAARPSRSRGHGCSARARLAIVGPVGRDASGHGRGRGRAGLVHAAVLACGLRLASAAWAAPADDANALLRAADDALSRGDHAGAAEGFAASYRALSRDQQHGPLGGRTIALAYEAYREAWHRARDPAPLQAAQALLHEHEVALEGVGKVAAVEENRLRQDWIEHLLELEQARAAAAVPAPACPEPAVVEPAVCPAPALEPGPKTPPVQPADAPPRRDGLGLALTAGGGVTLLGGIGLLIGGTQVLPMARREVVAAGRDPNDPVPQDAAYLEQHRGRGRTFMIAGGVVAGVGAAVATWGVVRLVGRGRGRSHDGRVEGREISVGLSPRAILLRARF